MTEENHLPNCLRIGLCGCDLLGKEEIDPEEEKFLAEQAKLIAEQEAIDHDANPLNVN